MVEMVEVEMEMEMENTVTRDYLMCLIGYIFLVGRSSSSIRRPYDAKVSRMMHVAELNLSHADIAA